MDFAPPSGGSSGSVEGHVNRKTMLPVIEKFMAAHKLPDVIVVADAGMISEANQKAIEAAGRSSSA